MTSAICTLFEGHYHLGAAVLINSLHTAGFRGRIICGLRGPLPPWSEPARTVEGDIRVRELCPGLEIWFVSLSTDMHLTNYKPAFLSEMWNGPARDAERLYYFDPDIVVKCPWEIVERWADGGLALCEDVNFSLPSGHPLRLGWTKFIAGLGHTTLQSRERYYNAGFIGVPSSQQFFLELWRSLIAAVGIQTGTLGDLKHGTAHSLFHTPDQDAMNLALMCSPVPVNAVGPEGMDFAPGGNLLSHAIGSRKPWRGGFIKEALRGYPPSAAIKSFFQYIDGPITVFSAAHQRRLQLTLKIAALIGRFYRRN